MKLQIKKLVLALTLAGWCQVATAQKYLTKQSEVDSFAQVVHSNTLINVQLYLMYDSTLSVNERITNLSAYDSLKLLYLVELVGFPWSDVRWFAGHSQWSNFTFINMPNLKTLSGIRESIGQLTFDNCPAIDVYPPQGSVKKNNNLTVKNVTKKTIRVDTKNMIRNEPRYNWIHIIDCNIDSLLIDDSGGSIYKYVVKNNPTLKLWKTKGGYPDLYFNVDSNPNLAHIQGFDKLYMASIGEEYGIKNCSKLFDLCDIREPLDSFYRFQKRVGKSHFNLNNNAPGASSYEELMAFDCTKPDTIAELGGLLETQSWCFLYPNPTIGQITIGLPTNGAKNSSVVIYNSQGVAVAIINPTGEEVVDLDLSYLPSGLYFVHWQSSQKNIVQKLVKSQ